jgi:hypothetical protein
VQTLSVDGAGEDEGVDDQALKVGQVVDIVDTFRLQVHSSTDYEFVISN